MKHRYYSSIETYRKISKKSKIEKTYRTYRKSSIEKEILFLSPKQYRILVFHKKKKKINKNHKLKLSALSPNISQHFYRLFLKLFIIHWISKYFVKYLYYTYDIPLLFLICKLIYKPKNIIYVISLTTSHNTTKVQKQEAKQLLLAEYFNIISLFQQRA